MNHYQKLLSADILHDFDEHLQVFYNRVLMSELDMENPQNVQRVRKALKVVVFSYTKQTLESLSSKIMFDTLEKRCAYVLKHCACFASAVARHFLSFLQSNPIILSRVFQQRRLDLCCLGGGPATDAVAVAKVVNSLKCLSTSQLEFNISVVNLSRHWQSTARKVVQALQDTPEFFCRDRIRIQFKFLQADLTGACPIRVTNLLRKADVVTMVYFVSAVNGSKNAEQCREMLEKIMQEIKPGATLFFLDSSKRVHYNIFRFAAHSVKDLTRVYGPHAWELHTLSMKSISTFMDLYSWQFDFFMCLSNCHLTCAAWVKGSTTACCRDCPLLCDNCDMSDEESPNAEKKKTTYRIRKQRQFRQRLEERFAPLMFESGDPVTEDPSGDETEFRPQVEKFLHAREAKWKKTIIGMERKRLMWSSIKVKQNERTKVQYETLDDIVEVFNGITSFNEAECFDFYSEKISRITKWTRSRKRVRET